MVTFFEDVPICLFCEVEKKKLEKMLKKYPRQTCESRVVIQNYAKTLKFHKKKSKNKQKKIKIFDPEIPRLDSIS